MAYRVASELSDRIAAVAPVGGQMGTQAPKAGQPALAIQLPPPKSKPINPQNDGQRQLPVVGKSDNDCALRECPDLHPPLGAA